MTSPSWKRISAATAGGGYLATRPVLRVAGPGARGENLLPKVRDWANQSSWIVSEGAPVFYVAIVLSG